MKVDITIKLTYPAHPRGYSTHSEMEAGSATWPLAAVTEVVFSPSNPLEKLYWKLLHPTLSGYVKLTSNFGDQDGESVLRKLR